MNDKEYLRYGSRQVITPVEGGESCLSVPGSIQNEDSPGYPQYNMAHTEAVRIDKRYKAPALTSESKDKFTLYMFNNLPPIINPHYEILK